eukprot:3728249-Heterocapsa_arctica.AAC.1
MHPRPIRQHMSQEIAYSNSPCNVLLQLLHNVATHQIAHECQVNAMLPTNIMIIYSGSGYPSGCSWVLLPRPTLSRHCSGPRKKSLSFGG